MRERLDLKWISDWDRTWFSNYGDMKWSEINMIKTAIDLFTRINKTIIPKCELRLLGPIIRVRLVDITSTF